MALGYIEASIDGLEPTEPPVEGLELPRILDPELSLEYPGPEFDEYTEAILGSGDIRVVAGNIRGVYNNDVPDGWRWCSVST
jgi:hypothetical protein